MIDRFFITSVAAMRVHRSFARVGIALRKGLLIYPVLLLVVVVSGCGESHDDESVADGHHSVFDRLHEQTEHDAGAEPASTPWLQGVSYTAVHEVGLDSLRPFYVADRAEHIGKFPCSECHTAPLAALQSIDPEYRKAHWDLSLNHAPSSTMQCATCHATNDMDSLHLLEGEQISFDESYQLCRQCHAVQADDWLGGAHGKRYGGWSEPRVVASCTACHNPHSPAWDIRFPARASRVVED